MRLSFNAVLIVESPEGTMPSPWRVDEALTKMGIKHSIGSRDGDPLTLEIQSEGSK